MRKVISFDTVKIFMACLVVAIHVYPFASVSQSFDFFFTHVFCRIAVPFFLMTTGYFVLPKAMNDFQVLKKYTFKILGLYAICILLYLPVNLYAHTFDGMGFLEILQVIFLNGTFYHLWYFPALILGMWLVYFVGFLVKSKRVNFVIFLLLYFVGLFGDSYYSVISRNSFFPSFYHVIFTVFDYTRNGVFYVPIFLYLGYVIRGQKKSKISCYSLSLFLVSLILMLIEGGILHFYNVQRHDSMYLLLIPTMYFLFSYVRQFSRGNKKQLRSIATVIYVIHPIVIIGVRVLARISHFSFFVTHSVINYFCVLFFSILFSILCYKCRQRFHF